MIKNLKYAPSQVELRTVMSPPVQYFNELFGDYYAMCQEVGLTSRFNNFPNKDSFSITDYSSKKNLEILRFSFVFLYPLSNNPAKTKTVADIIKWVMFCSSLDKR